MKIVFKDIQKQQQNLTQEERDALILYKAAFYRPINKIVGFLRQHNLTVQDIESNEMVAGRVKQIISNCYEKYVNSRRKEKIIWKQPNALERVEKEYKGIPNITMYRELVLKSIPYLESALNKIKIIEDIYVYRGVVGNELAPDQRFLSTTCKSTVAYAFMYDRLQNSKKQKDCYNVFEIKIPKGSPVIAFTDDLFTDELREGSVFCEEQQEILIDPINFEFEFTEISNGRIYCEAKPKNKSNIK